MNVALTSDYNGYTHAQIELIDFVLSQVHFRLANAVGETRAELNVAPFDSNLATLGAQISAELQAHA